MILPFDPASGALPPGVHEAACAEIEDGGELFVAKFPADERLTFLEFFQQDRNRRPKGIIAIDLLSLAVQREEEGAP